MNSRKGVKLKIPVIVMHFFIEIQVYLEDSVDLTIAGNALWRPSH